MRLMQVLVGVLVAVAITTAIREGWIPWFKFGADPKSAAFLSQVASEVNKSTPMMVDKETELLNTMGLEGTFVYNYRLVNYMVEELDVDEFYGVMKADVTKAACTTPDTRKKFLDQGIVLRYTYADKNRRHVTQVDVSLADCES